jgi:hypothetical protein
MDIRQAGNMALIDRFAHEDAGFAHPTQTVYFTQAGAPPGRADSKA